MPSTPNPLVVPNKEQLRDPMGSEIQHFTDVVNENFAAPSNPTNIAPQYTDFTPEPFKSEFQSLSAQLNISFAQIQASTVASPIVLQNPEQMPEPYLGAFLYFVSAVNQGLAALFP
jgi:hypothetical protein